MNGSGLVVTNTGQIQGNTQGIGFGNVTAATGATVTNFGTITGVISHGVFLRSGGAVTNAFGATIETLQANPLIATAGVWILDQPGTVINSGEIHAFTSNGVLVDAGGSITNNATGVITGLRGVAGNFAAPITIVNHGSVTGNAIYGAGLYGGGTLTNTGTIAGQLSGVEVRSFVTVTNSGTINSVAGPGVLFTPHQTSNIVAADIVNEAGGTIQAGNGIGVDAQLATGNSQVTNRGTINGSVLMGAGDDIVALAAGSALGGNIDGGAGTNGLQLLRGIQNSSILTSNVTNTQTVTVDAANTTWELAQGFTVSGNATVQAGTFLVNGALPGAVGVQNGATLGGDGTVGATTVANGGILSPGNSIGTLHVNGNFVLGAGSIYEVELNAAGQSDKVMVQGTVNLSGAVLRVLAENDNYNVSTDYLIIDNDGTDAVTGKFSQVTTNFAFLTPVVLYDAGDGNDVVLTLINTATDFCAVAQTKNECNVAHALDKFPADDPLFRAVLFQTAAGAREAFNALSGEIHATLPGVLADDSRYVREAVLGRLMQATYTNTNGRITALGANGPQVAMLGAGPSLNEQTMALGSEGKSLSVPATAPGIAFWTRGYGAWGDFDGNRNAATADRDLGGFVSGADAQVSGTWRVGLAAGGAWSDISVDARRSHAEVESFHLAGYAGGMAGPLALRGGGAWAWQDVDTSRAVVFPGFFERQEASYDADTGQIFGEVAYPMAMGGVALEPFAGLAYVSIETDRFTERGGALSSLAVRGNDLDVGYSTLGLRAASVVHLSNMMTVVPKVSAAWQHAFDDVTPDAALAFATTGIGFGITGVPLAENSLLFEAGLDLNLSPNATVGVSYSGQFASDVTDNAVKGRLTWLF